MFDHFRRIPRSQEARSGIMRSPVVLAAVGTVSLIGTLGLSGIAGAQTPKANHSASHPAEHARPIHLSPFGAGRVSGRRDVASFGGAHSSPAAPSGTLYVNEKTGKDTGTCRLQSHPCKTIDYAISVAPASAVIKVADGTYPETVAVTTGGQDITIEGASEQKTVIKPTSVTASYSDSDSSDPVYPIVYAAPTTTLKIEDLTVNGTGARASVTGGENYTGVYYHDSSGALTDVTVTGIELPSNDFGDQDGMAIYADSDSSGTTSVTMTSVTVNKYDKNGITCDDAATTCTIKKSTVTGIGATDLIAQNGIQGYDALKVVLSKDTVTGNTYITPSGQQGYDACGILLIDNATSNVKSTTADSDDIGIYAQNDGGSSSSTVAISISKSTASDATNESGYGGLGIGVDSILTGTLSGDTTSGDDGDGVALYGASGVTVENGTADHGYDGIYVGGEGTNGLGSTDNTIEGNVTSNNSDDGILADTDTSSNTFTGNTADTNTTYDYQDLSTGSGTAGTANTWSGNTCSPAHDSSPEGLC